MRALRGLMAGAVLGLASVAAGAAEPREGGYWWGSASIGAASLKRSYSVTPDTSDSAFALAFEVGYAWHPQLLLGVELGGWTLEAGDWWTPNEGEGIQTLYLVARYYPRQSSTFFVKGGYGNLSYWNHRYGESGGSGSGGVLGLGKDFPTSGRWNATPSLEYAWGQIHGAMSPPGVTQDQDFRALTLRIGITFR